MSRGPLEDDDAALARRCSAGDAEAWSLLVRRYQRLVYAIVLRTGLDEHAAADVFQTVFERLLRHVCGLTDPSRLQAWIVTTAKREALRARERGRRTESMTRADEDGDDEWDIADDGATAEQQLDALQQLHRLRLGLEQLDARCRDLLKLLFRDDDDRVAYEDVARQLDLPVGSIGPTRSRCLGKLRRIVVE